MVNVLRGAGGGGVLICSEGSIVQWAVQQNLPVGDVHGRQAAVGRTLGSPGAMPGLCEVDNTGLRGSCRTVWLSLRLPYHLSLAWGSMSPQSCNIF